MKKILTLSALGLALLFITGCGNEGAPVDVPKSDRVPRKEFKDMTKEEKIEFINRTPMPEEAKKKQIEQINAGQL